MPAAPRQLLIALCLLIGGLIFPAATAEARAVVSGRFKGETITAAAGSTSHLAGASFTPGYDALERRSSFTAALGTATVTQGYGYDAASRLSSAEQGNVRATFARHPLSPLIGSITFTDTAAGNAQRLVETRVHDHLDRLQSITSANAAGFARGFSYRLNAAGQRERVDETGGAAWAWQYDALGQLTNASREQITDSSGTTSAPVPGEQFGYTYDGIGNRLASSRGDTPDSATHAEQAAYTPNLLNQYTSRTHPGAVNVSGTARTAATVTVNGQATTRTPVEGGTGSAAVPAASLFHTRLTADNTTSPALFDATILATEGSTTEQETRRALVPPATETYLHDADGNLTQDALWTYTWDAENRLPQMESRADLPAGTVRQRLTFAYDAGGRRIRKTVHTALPGTDPVQWVLTTDRRFLYDGWNLVAEIDPDGTAYRTYLWGLDLSGTPQGAGGTHGLLAVFLRPASAAGPGPQPAPEAHLCVYDGNGNMSSLVAAAPIPAANGQPAIAAGSETARYTYDPFGSPLSATGPAALRNAIGFSTRYRDEESGLLYYGYRYYDPADGRWLNRDPIGERGGLNLYGMCYNSLQNMVDRFGRAPMSAGIGGPSIIPPYGWPLFQIPAKPTMPEIDLVFDMGGTPRLFGMDINFAPYEFIVDGYTFGFHSADEVNSFSELKSKVLEYVGIGESGDGCPKKCIKSLKIVIHGSPGVLSASAGYEYGIQLPKNASITDVTSALPDFQKQSAIQALMEIDSYLCDDGYISMLACSAGKGGDLPKLFSRTLKHPVHFYSNDLFILGCTPLFEIDSAPYAGRLTSWYPQDPEMGAISWPDIGFFPLPLEPWLTPIGRQDSLQDWIDQVVPNPFR